MRCLTSQLRTPVPNAYTIDVRLGPGDLERALREDVRTGLSSTPKRLSPKWHYDERGSALFSAITRLPEYYLTRCERSILVDHAPAIARAAGATTLIELGSGTSEKTRLLLDAMGGEGLLQQFVPFDVDEGTLRGAAAAIAAAYPGVAVHAVVADFERHLDSLPPGGGRLVAFLGSTIGNLEPDARARFLAAVARALEPGDSLLLGTDLVKASERILPAYDDALGVTAAFSRNVLAVVNERLGANFAVAEFEHVPRWDAERELVDIRVRTRIAQTVTVAGLGMRVELAAGEEILTEISAKFRRSGVEAELAGAGLELASWHTDPGGNFAVSLSTRP